MNNWIDVASTNEIKENDCKVIEHKHTPIAIFNLDQQFYAIQDNCPHQHMPLADGEVVDCTITCPFHGAKFDIKTGEVLSPPACENLITYATRVKDGKVQVQVCDQDI